MAKDVKAQLALLLQQKREATCKREIILARAEKKIADLTEDAELATLEIDKDLVALEEKARNILVSNPELFVNPRTMSTPDGKFGFRTSVSVDIADEDKALDAILDRGYDDCLRVVRHFNKQRIRDRLTDGERIASCSIVEIDDPVFEVKKALVSKAVDNAMAG